MNATDSTYLPWRCPMCHVHAVPVNVHGHVQCSHCGQNVDPCCSGETAACSKGPGDSPRT